MRQLIVPTAHLRAVAACLVLVAAPALHAGAQSDSAKREAVAKVLQPAYFGIPASPAFELLPDKPSEVTHLLTPKDFKAGVQTWQDNGKLKVGLAVDSRPFVSSAGDLTKYAEDWARQVAFRTVLSAGTAAAAEGSDDVLFAIGVRIPLVDKGDPRTHLSYQDSLATAYRAELKKEQPPLRATPEELAARAKRASEALAPLREEFAKSNWNAFKLDVGLAASSRARSGAAVKDSVRHEGAGVWLATALPMGRSMQLTVAGKSTWQHSDSATDETNRRSAGARVVILGTPRMSVSVEAASVWSRYAHDSSLNERWTHLGAVVEWAVPELGGWLGVSYGGDSARREKPNDRFALNYAFYVDRILK